MRMEMAETVDSRRKADRGSRTRQYPGMSSPVLPRHGEPENQGRVPDKEFFRPRTGDKGSFQKVTQGSLPTSHEGRIVAPQGQYSRSDKDHADKQEFDPNHRPEDDLP